MVQGINGKNPNIQTAHTTPTFTQRVAAFLTPHPDKTNLAELDTKGFYGTLGLNLSTTTDPLADEALALGPSKFTPLKNPEAAAQYLGTYGNAVQSISDFTHNYDPVDMMQEQYNVT